MGSGVSSEAALRAAVSTAINTPSGRRRRPHDPRKWKISHVSTWLQEQELHALVDTFKDHCVDGQMLLDDCREEDFAVLISFPPLRRKFKRCHEELARCASAYGAGLDTVGSAEIYQGLVQLNETLHFLANTLTEGQIQIPRGAAPRKDQVLAAPSPSTQQDLASNEGNNEKSRNIERTLNTSPGASYEHHDAACRATQQQPKNEGSISAVTAGAAAATVAAVGMTTAVLMSGQHAEGDEAHLPTTVVHAADTQNQDPQGRTQEDKHAKRRARRERKGQHKIQESEVSAISADIGADDQAAGEKREEEGTDHESDDDEETSGEEPTGDETETYNALDMYEQAEAEEAEEGDTGGVAEEEAQVFVRAHLFVGAGKQPA